MEIRYPKIASYKKGTISPNVLETRKLKNEAIKLKASQEFQNIIDKMRSEMWHPNIDITRNIIREEEKINETRVVKYYYNEENFENLIMYFHGGGFYGGSVETVENYCKYLSQETGYTVLSVDYNLAPEYKFPSSINQGYSLLEYYSNKYINIHIAGDSAGGSIATSILLKDIYENSKILKSLILYYPVLLIELSENRREDFIWDISKYDIKNELENSNIAKSEASGLKYAMNFMKKIYLNEDEDATNPFISQINTPDEILKQFPKTIIFTVEYDYLRLEAEYFYERLKINNVNSKCIRYAGQVHAFIDKIGYCDEIIDSVDEIKKFI